MFPYPNWDSWSPSPSLYPEPPRSSPCLSPLPLLCQHPVVSFVLPLNRAVFLSSTYAILSLGLTTFKRPSMATACPLDRWSPLSLELHATLPRVRPLCLQDVLQLPISVSASLHSTELPEGRDYVRGSTTENPASAWYILGIRMSDEWMSEWMTIACLPPWCIHSFNKYLWATTYDLHYVVTLKCQNKPMHLSSKLCMHKLCMWSVNSTHSRELTHIYKYQS